MNVFLCLKVKLVPFDGSVEGCDIENSVSDDAQHEMIAQLRKVFIERCKSAPEFVQNLIQLVYEAADREAI